MAVEREKFDLFNGMSLVYLKIKLGTDRLTIDDRSTINWYVRGIR